MARAIIEPDFRHAMTISQVLKAVLGESEQAPGHSDFADAAKDIASAAEKGDLAFASRMLATQAVTLDTIFVEMARRMAINMREYLGATETFGRIAMKAQAQSRATLEALAKLHQPREQTVRHVHVNEGGQAVIADQFHNHSGGTENGETGKQVHEQGTCGPALLGTDPRGNGMPITCPERQASMSIARGTVDGSA
ncbi:MAG: hypothetical protein IPK89_09960 [Sphingomonadales bacterium]|nr:hypothetical protein [Sphingomonadales bacterium]